MDAFRPTGSSSAYNNNGLDHLQPHQHQQMLRINAAHGGGGDVVTPHTTLHVNAAVEMDPYDEKRLEDLRRTLLSLEEIASGRHVVNWKELVDPSQPVESAKNISAALAKPTTLASAIENVAECIKTPAHLSIVACLDPPFWSKVRDAVLQDLLNTLTTVRDPHPMPVCSEMLAEMVRLNLVVLRGVATTLEALLSEVNTRRAAIAVLGKLADQNRGDEVFLRAVQNVEPLVRAIQEPEYDYDRLAIIRLLGWGGVENAATLVPVKTLKQPCPVTSMTYFRQRDELASATCDGEVVIWGSPNPITGEVRPAVTIDMPQRCVPVALDGPQRGNYLVIAAMPFHTGSLHAMMRENSTSPGSTGSGSTGNKKQNLSTGPAKGPMLRFATCNDSNGTWTVGESISRKENVTLTAVAALANLVVCTAESAVTERSSEPCMQHDLVLLNGHTAQALRRFERAHDDCVTIIRVGEESDHILLTGSRDCVVKMWDIRSGSNRSSVSTATASSAAAMPVATPTHRIEKVHTDTITAILPHHKALFTASLDGSLFMWDVRRMSAPVHEMHVLAPILDIAPADGGHVAVATARSLSLISLDTLKTQDVIPNVAYTQLKTNYDGSVLFAADSSGISVYGVRR